MPGFASVVSLMWMFLMGTSVLPCGVERFYRGVERCACITVRSLAFKMLAFAELVVLFVSGEALSARRRR